MRKCFVLFCFFFLSTFWVEEGLICWVNLRIPGHAQPSISFFIGRSCLCGSITAPTLKPPQGARPSLCSLVLEFTITSLKASSSTCLYRYYRWSLASNNHLFFIKPVFINTFYLFLLNWIMYHWKSINYIWNILVFKNQIAHAHTNKFFCFIPQLDQKSGKTHGMPVTEIPQEAQNGLRRKLHWWGKLCGLLLVSVHALVASGCNFSFPGPWSCNTCPLFYLSIFLKYSVYLFRERVGGREKEKERNINVWLPLTCPQSWTSP